MKSKNILSILVIAVICTFIFTSCGSSGSGSTNSGSSSKTTATTEKFDVSVNYDSDDLNSSYSSSDATKITLKDTTAKVSGDGAKADGSTVKITSAGTYIVSGTLKDGQIIVDTDDSGIVKLVLKDADITCSSSAPIYIKNSEKTVITLADNTANSLTDGASYELESNSDEPNAALFSKSDLTINGSGSLTVDANYNDGIVSKDELKIVSGNITVNSVDDGIRGRDFVGIKDGTVKVTAEGDAIRSNNTQESEKGYVCIEGGTLTLTSQGDGIQAASSVLIKGGKISIKSGGGSSNSKSAEKSKKGIKAPVDITIAGGTIDINSADDAIHSSDSVTISGGTISISSGDDGIHADTDMTISNAAIDITKSYEGIESIAITINSGTINIVSSDDGINGAGGVDSSGSMSQGNTSSENCSLTINGGYIVVNGNGDGIDVNGSIAMTDGTVIVNGPTADNNGALDYDSTFKMTGGYIVAVGSAGMAMTPDSSSTQYSVMINFSSAIQAGTLVHIETSDGKDILTFAPVKNYQSVVICSSALEKGTTYNVYTGGSSTGTVKDCLYSGGTYTKGTLFDSFTISSTITKVGSYTSQNGGGGGNMSQNRWK